jgi:DNA-directed RNA polymerase II subunit RPB2
MKNGTRRYDTSSIKLANDFQQLCIHAGWSANIYLKYKVGHQVPQKSGRIITSTVDSWRITIITKQCEPLVNKNTNKKLDKLINYKGNVHCCTVSSGILMVRRNKIPVLSGNSRAGQKGTCGIVLEECDMPYTEDGLQPDLIISPSAIPSRMTIGHLIEAVCAEYAVKKGITFDATAFEDVRLEDILNDMKKNGNSVNKKMYNGFTGEEIEMGLYIKPTYYQRLKHMVDDKIHARPEGIIQTLTRQPTEGRSKDGGLRFGEMERDVVLAHGTSYFLRERMMDSSDPYAPHICDICGSFASKMSNNNTYYCAPCDNQSRISQVQMPYVMKLLTQELMSMGIMSSFFTENSL